MTRNLLINSQKKRLNIQKVLIRNC